MVYLGALLRQALNLGIHPIILATTNGDLYHLVVPSPNKWDGAVALIM